MRIFSWFFLICSVIAFPNSTRAAISLSAPKARQIVQRSESNVGRFTINGVVSAVTNLARVEARLVVMAGTTNNGVSTDWVGLTIVSTNGDFTGAVTNIAAGGWYRLEVRGLDADTNELAMVAVDRVGIGDVFVTTGQSNAGGWGSPLQMTSDDRVSAYVVASKGWQLGNDSQPENTGGVGSGGSPWPILGSLLIASNHVPVGFVGLAVGGSSLASWLPGTTSFQNVSNVLRAFGTNGVRAVLWHQGETDAANLTTTSNYFQMLNTVITQSRVVAGWSVPWGIAEVSYGGTGQEAVMAGQRLCIYNTPNCFRGARTDDFHLEGKLSDFVHFNGAGLADHAQQWANALCGVEDLTIKNGNFEANAVLLEGRVDFTTQIVGWNRINTGGDGTTAGNSGYLNPTTSTYLNSGDTINGGVLTNMNGKHVATLYATTSVAPGGDAFVQTLRAHLQPSTIYTLQVAIGLRNANVFGGYQLDFLANGVPLGAGVAGNAAILNALAGGSATNKFTLVSCVLTSTVPAPAGQQLAIRIAKPAGGSTYLDFDDVRLTSQLTPYGKWQMTNWNSLTLSNSFPGADPDGDGLPNLVEFQMAGANPLVVTAMPELVLVQIGGENYWQMQVLKNPAGTGAIEIQMSYDLSSWLSPVSSGNGDLIVINDATQFTVQLRRSVTPKAFFRIAARL